MSPAELNEDLAREGAYNNKATPSPTTILEPAHKRARHHNTDAEQRQQPKQASLAAGTNPHPWSQLQRHLLRQPVLIEPEEPNRASARCSDSYTTKHFASKLPV